MNVGHQFVIKHLICPAIWPKRTLDLSNALFYLPWGDKCQGAAGRTWGRTKGRRGRQGVGVNLQQEICRRTWGRPPPPPPLHPPLVRETEKEYGEEVQFTDRLLTSVSDSDAIWFKTCQEIEGSYADYVGKLFNKPVLLAGPVLPEMPNSSLDEKWVNWLDQFEPRLTFAIYILFLLVVLHFFNSWCMLPKAQFQELILGFESTGTPFSAAWKPPFGCETIESALPDGF
ncbi:unnamed protein product [Rhodiola kirilowii]